MDDVGSLDTPSEWIEVVEMEGDGVVVLRGFEGRLKGSTSPFMFAVGSSLKEIFDVGKVKCRVEVKLL